MSGTESEPEAYVRQMVMNSLVDATNEHKFSLMTYNILNDTCIKDKYLYCPEDLRYMPHRSRLIISEIKLFKPDIICMQEVHPDVFKEMLQKPLDVLGYAGLHFCRKGSLVHQGDAIFFRKNMFGLAESRALRFQDIAFQEFEAYKNLDSLTKEALNKHMDLPDQVILVRFMHKATNKYIHVASLHALWGLLQKPDIQTMQVCTAIRSLQKFMADFDDPLCIIAGDFNTPPTFPVYQMLEETAAPNFQSISMLKTAAYRRDDGKVECMVDTVPEAFAINLKLVSSYKYVTGSEPEITNCDDGFSDEPCRLCLDYIWFSPETLDVARVLKTPPVEDITKHVGLPSILFGSDHLPLLTEFIFK